VLIWIIKLFFQRLTQVLLKFQYLTTKKKIKNLKQNIEELYFELGEVGKNLMKLKKTLFYLIQSI